jgi:hypothetical protein
MIAVLFVLQSASGIWNVTRGSAQGARRDGGQTRFVERSLLIAGELNDSSCNCTRLPGMGVSFQSPDNDNWLDEQV